MNEECCQSEGGAERGSAGYGECRGGGGGREVESGACRVSAGRGSLQDEPIYHPFGLQVAPIHTQGSNHHNDFRLMQ